MQNTTTRAIENISKGFKGFIFKYVLVFFFSVFFVGCNLKSNEQCSAEANEYLSKTIVLAMSVPEDKLNENQRKEIASALFTLVSYSERIKYGGNFTCSDLNVIERNSNIIKKQTESGE